MKKLLILSIVLLSACNPCKQVARHPECFPADTIREIEKVIHYETEYITNDSIIIDSIPCLPDSTVAVPTVYKTIHKTVIDTVYESKEEIKINPINQDLVEENKNLGVKASKMKLYRRLFFGLVGLILILLILKATIGNKYKR